MTTSTAIANHLRSPLAMVCNLMLCFVVYWLCRIIYIAENAAAFATLWSDNSLADIMAGAYAFDASAICYTNAPYALLMLIPLHVKESHVWQDAAKWLFVVTNSVAVVVNLADAAYFPYTGRRTTVSVFSEFAAEGNIGSIFATEMLRHWYLVVAGIALIAILCTGYRRGGSRQQPRRQAGHATAAYYIVQVVALAAYLPYCISSMRGGLSHAVRPITISNATQYVARPAHAAAVLNTPFALLRTLGKHAFTPPPFFASTAEAERYYSPLHTPDADTQPRPFNVVVLIVESFGAEYIGALNPTLDGGRYAGYTPFTDELIARSATFATSLANGRKSIDGMPSILSSIPMCVEPFFLTPSSMNDVGGLAAELSRRGYATAFFHGAENGSMGFQAFARKTGYGSYYGRTEYNADPATAGDADFDGMWAIWDEPFLQYFCRTMGTMQEPFLTTVFTASSHHPFRIPEEYRDTFPDGALPIHRCIRYTDHALRRFFQTASRQPWYGHTLFVLTADHTNLSDHDVYQTDLGRFRVPILFFDPSATLLTPGCRDGIAQQIDIMPSVLGLLGHKEPYVAFGKDLFATPADSTWAVSYTGGIYQYVAGGRLLQMDGTTGQARALYSLSDSLLRHNLMAEQPDTLMEQRLRSIVYQYMSRMSANELIVR